MLRWLRDAAITLLALPLGALIYFAAIGAIVGACYVLVLIVRAVAG